MEWRYIQESKWEQKKKEKKKKGYIHVVIIKERRAMDKNFKHTGGYNLYSRREREKAWE